MFLVVGRRGGSSAAHRGGDGPIWAHPRPPNENENATVCGPRMSRLCRNEPAIQDSYHMEGYSSSIHAHDMIPPYRHQYRRLRANDTQLRVADINKERLLIPLLHRHCCRRDRSVEVAKTICVQRSQQGYFIRSSGDLKLYRSFIWETGRRYDGDEIRG
jgi:hypothetical protein